MIQPKEITDIKKFLQVATGDEKDQKNQKVKSTFQKSESINSALFIKHGKKVTKFKLRAKKYLYTFQTPDKDKATRLTQSLPQSFVDLKQILRRLSLNPRKSQPRRRARNKYS